MSHINKVVFLGSKKLGLETLKIIWKLRPDAIQGVVTFDDRDDSRSVLSLFIEFCDQAGIELRITETRQAAEDAVRSLDPDLCLVVCWYWLLSRSLLDDVRHGILGIHNSLLPKYRGGSPLVWSMINGEKETGFSIFSFTNDMDAGDIWLQEIVKITDTDTIATLLERIEAKVLDVLNHQWCALLDGQVIAFAQNQSEATYCAQRMPDDGEVDWGLNARAVYNFIRAQTTPYPGAFTIHNGKQVTLLSAEPFNPNYFGTPGQVARVGSEGVYVICGDHKAIVLKTVLVEGEVLPANKFFTSIKIRLGKGE